MLLELAEELVEELGLYLLCSLSLLAALSNSLKHAYALILAEGAHLLHPVDAVQNPSWRVAKPHQAGGHHADVLVQELVEIVKDLALNQGQSSLVGHEQLDRYALVLL